MNLTSHQPNGYDTNASLGAMTVQKPHKERCFGGRAFLILLAVEYHLANEIHRILTIKKSVLEYIKKVLKHVFSS